MTHEEDFLDKEVAEWLAEWSGPAVTGNETAELTTRLLAQMPKRPSWLTYFGGVTNTWPWQLLGAQIRIIRRELWAASSLIFLLGISVTLFSGNSAVPTFLFVRGASILAAITLSLLYGPDVDPAMELTQATSISTHTILLARLALVFGFDLMLALTGSILMAWTQPGILFWPLVSSWLAPMTFLSAFAFLVAVITLRAEAGALFSLVIWVVQLLFKENDPNNLLFIWPDLNAANFRPWLWLLALAMGLFAFWYAGRSEKWLRA
jgi:hypothetical protein